MRVIICVIIAIIFFFFFIITVFYFIFILFALCSVIKLYNINSFERLGLAFAARARRSWPNNANGRGTMDTIATDIKNHFFVENDKLINVQKKKKEKKQYNNNRIVRIIRK